MGLPVAMHRSTADRQANGRIFAGGVGDDGCSWLWRV